MNTTFDAVLAALENNNGIAVDDHLAYKPDPADREVKVEVIGSILGEAVFLEDMESIAPGYSINRMMVDDAGIVHITKNSVSVLYSGSEKSLRKAIEVHNAQPGIIREVLDVTYLAKNLGKFEVAGSSCSLCRETDGMYSIHLSESSGIKSVSFHETKVRANAQFKKLVEQMLNAM